MELEGLCQMACRDGIVEDVRRLLVGPGLGKPVNGSLDREIIEGRLSLAYMMGMLFPVGDTAGAGAVEDEASAEDGEEEEDDDPLSMATAMLPSSMGITVCLGANAVVSVSVRGARYERLASEPESAGSEGAAKTKGNRRRPSKRASEQWSRVPFEDARKTVGVSGSGPEEIFEGRARLEFLSRSLPDGNFLLTVSVSNTKKGGRQKSAEDTLFQVGIRIETVKGQILQYPAPAFIPPTDDERELRVVYGQQRPYAAGHGVAAGWDASNDVCKAVWTDSVPTAHVWRPVFDRLTIEERGRAEQFVDPELFSVWRLANENASLEVIGSKMRSLVKFYERWIRTQQDLEVDPNLKGDAERMLERCQDSARRMNEGIDLLLARRDLFRCFQLANMAMLISMAHSARSSGRSRSDKKQGPFDLGDADTSRIDYSSVGASWRPFQLAFFLQVLPSLVSDSHSDRDLVDVIWFATGGGKTEAYLLISAFELLRRRLEHKGSGAGTGVINRYTYRFLTADQFQRTAGVICALEAIRRERHATTDPWLGEKEFSIGLFAGGDVSPNEWGDARDKHVELMDASDPRASNPFPIESCPYCGTLLVPREARRLPDGSPDVGFYGFNSSANSFSVFCPDEDCEFHGGLPIKFIDAALYDDPPSFLLGTVDKFAMVPWNGKSGKLFGVGTRFKPPSLVIQDELHLISGPLGTLAGIYEAAFEVLIEASGGARPKVIASTATIRNSSLQCRRIYGRRSSVFPSPGLRSHDSFFSKLDVGNVDRSRLYVGVMAQGLRSTVAASWTMAAMLQSVANAGHEGRASNDEIDAYWTLVAYHNSKRELGRITNATRDEIPTRLQVYAKEGAGTRPSNFQVLELKAHSEVPVPQARQLLARRHQADEPAIDIVPCTNIISVGVDIDRLGLMMVNGQPKLSSEYIQATSRVGRGSVPGLVVACYSPSKPRDRSHYEAFRDYHERFYSFVEPTSVTPGALPAIDRALHAALVTVVRHGAGLLENDAAARFNPSTPRVALAIERLGHRIRAAYGAPEESEERERLSSKLTERVTEWQVWAQQHTNLRYRIASQQLGPTLLVRFGDKRTDDVGWHTLQSMRHVDKEIFLEIANGG